MLRFRSRRSNGIRVSAAVHRLISRANAARDREDWAEAARFYRAALAADPSLGHIQVQLGHAAKESGDHPAAEAAYREAGRLSPQSADPALHLGHLLGLQERRAEALDAYMEALRRDPRQADAATALHRALEHAGGQRRAAILDLLRGTLPAGPVPDTPPPGEDLPGTACVFDVSDLLMFWLGARAPTGIQRVQIEITTHAIRHPEGPVRICCFVGGRNEWLQVPPARFAALVRLSRSGSDREDPDWAGALNGLFLHLALAEPFAFPRGAVLLNLGSSWALPNYFLLVRAARDRFGISYVPLVYDLISALRPRHFLRAARQEIVPWLVGMMDHADAVLVISEATKKDLLAVAATTGRSLGDADVEVVRLDADFRGGGEEDEGERPAPAAGSAGPDPFVLFVSTVESRKGHEQALEAWSLLLERLPPGRLPRLVCVGRRGWLSGGVYARLGREPALAARVSMRPSVSDVELAGLYRDCLFTIYPSHAEGWGLPVTESLCFGKPVITTDSSSLPEAGGPFAVYVPAGDAAALAGAAERMIGDAAFREARAAHIRAEFRPRRWADLSAQVQGAARRLPAPPPRPAPPARLGFFHPLSRSTEMRLWSGSGSGEVFRDGTGWAIPDAEGCRTRPGGGALRIGVPTGHGALRLGLLLRADDAAETGWEVDVHGGPALSGTLEPGRRKWVMLDVPPLPEDGELRLRLRGRPAWDAPGQLAGEVPGEVPEDEAGDIPLPALAGFLLHDVEDAEAAWRFHEALSLGNLDDLDAYRPPEPAAAGPRWRPALRPAGPQPGALQPGGTEAL